VVAEGPDVELHLVRGLDRGLVVKVTRDERRGSHHVTGVHTDRAPGVRFGRPIEPGAEPGHAAEARLWGLEMPVEVVHAEQLQVHEPLALLLCARGFVGAGVQPEQRNEKSGPKGGRSGQQVTGIDQSHGRKLGPICRGFVSESWPWRERAVKGYLRRMRVMDCDCGQTLQAGNDDDLVKEARAHVEQEHPDMQLTDEQVRELVAAKAYEASDS
jgi:hypothetical protein